MSDNWLKRRRHSDPWASPVNSSPFDSLIGQITPVVGGIVANAIASQFGSGRADTQIQTDEIVRKLKTRGTKSFAAGRYKKRGKISKKLKITKVKTKKGKKTKTVKHTPKGFAEKGITYRHEMRQFDSAPKTAGGDPETDPAKTIECKVVGHASMPSKITFANIWRAVYKMLFAKVGIEIRTMNNIMVSENGISAGDAVRVNYYSSLSATSISAVTVLVGLTSTFEDHANALAGQLRTLGLTNGVFPNYETIRWDTIEFVPTSNSPFRQVNIRFENIMIECRSKSHLKVQNRTGIVNDENTLDNVPLSGRIHYCKGNNMKWLSNRRLPSLVKYDTELLMQDGGVAAPSGGVSNNEVPDAPNKQFNNLSDVPEHYQIRNVKNTTKALIQPGNIKTTTVKGYFKMPLWKVLNILRNTTNISNDAFAYSPLGECAFMCLEKVIGFRGSAPPNTTPAALHSVLLGYEVAFEQQVIATAGRSVAYTEPLNIQEDL